MDFNISVIRFLEYREYGQLKGISVHQNFFSILLVALTSKIYLSFPIFISSNYLDSKDLLQIYTGIKYLGKSIILIAHKVLHRLIKFNLLKDHLGTKQKIRFLLSKNPQTKNSENKSYKLPRKYIYLSKLSDTSKMATQREIDDLLQDSWCESSTLNNGLPNQKSKVQEVDKYEESQDQYKESRDEYGQEDFEDFEESRKTNNIGHSQSQIQMSKKHKKSNELMPIAQYPPKENRKQKLALTVTDKPKKEEKFAKTALTNVDKLHLAHNYARLQERERELLLTTLSESNKQLKNQLQQKNNQIKKLQNKYKVLLEQKVQQSASSVKQQALEKKVSVLESKLQKINGLYKMQVQKGKYKTKISNTIQNFIPQEEFDRRESQYVEIIQKLKNRMIQSDENLKVLQKKLNQSIQYNDQLMRKMRRVEQVEHRIQKMNQQAQTDREYIQLLKEKVKEAEKKWQNQKDRCLKLEHEMRRMEMGHDTNKDLIEELKEVRRQKQLLQNSLKQMSSGLMAKLRSNGSGKPVSYQKMQDLQIG